MSVVRNSLSLFTRLGISMGRIAKLSQMSRTVLFPLGSDSERLWTSTPLSRSSGFSDSVDLKFPVCLLSFLDVCLSWDLPERTHKSTHDYSSTYTLWWFSTLLLVVFPSPLCDGSWVGLGPYPLHGWSVYVLEDKVSCNSPSYESSQNEVLILY